ncbi:hypothetical protein CRENBAI_019902 [Crenichthys baileyi]|uniref:Uncharacterized protein n=1 Tax=Crenichthys baileyi TaxID=28760 RepID=A0AAV9SRS9_9TELE
MEMESAFCETKVVVALPGCGSRCFQEEFLPAPKTNHHPCAEDAGSTILPGISQYFLFPRLPNADDAVIEKLPLLFWKHLSLLLTSTCRCLSHSYHVSLCLIFLLLSSPTGGSRLACLLFPLQIPIKDLRRGGSDVLSTFSTSSSVQGSSGIHTALLCSSVDSIVYCTSLLPSSVPPILQGSNAGLQGIFAAGFLVSFHKSPIDRLNCSGFFAGSSIKVGMATLM